MSNTDRLASKDQLRWACQRGMLELDVILTRFLDRGYDQLTQQEQSLFQTLLTMDDPVLLTWLTGETEPDTPTMQHLIQKIRSFV